MARSKKRKKPSKTSKRLGVFLGYRWVPVNFRGHIMNSDTFWLHEVSALQQSGRSVRRVAIYALPVAKLKVRFPRGKFKL